MEAQAPRTLQRLVVESLLKKEALAISALADLPWLLFPATFEVAFRKHQTNILRAMVPAWPLTCLPVGALMEYPYLETLKALLDGLDVLIAEEACPSSRKLRVLDLTNRNFTTKWHGTRKGCFSGQVTRQKKPVATCPYSGVKRYLNVITDLEIKKSGCDECTTHLWQWARQRTGSVHLCCRKLEIYTSTHLPIAIDLLRSVDLLCVRVLKMRYIWIKDMAALGPYLRQMSNLHTLILVHIMKDSSIAESEQLQEECMKSLISQLPKFHCLQHLYIAYSDALAGSLADCLRCLKKPLETLSITFSDLIQRDWDYLPLCPNLSVLKHLDLTYTTLDGSIKPLGDLFERVKDTLQSLYLVKCGLKDSHFSALMPALSQCSQLLKIDFHLNDLSLPVLKQLLHHTAKLNKLTEETYPVPLEYYDEHRVRGCRLDQLGPELLDIFQTKRHLKAVTYEQTTIHVICDVSITQTAAVAGESLQQVAA